MKAGMTLSNKLIFVALKREKQMEKENTCLLFPRSQHLGHSYEGQK